MRRREDRQSSGCISPAARHKSPDNLIDPVLYFIPYRLRE